MKDLGELYEHNPYVPAEGEPAQPTAIEPRDEQQLRDRFEIAERIRVAVVSDKKGVMTEDDRDALRSFSRSLFSFDNLPEYLQGKIERVEKDLRKRLAREGLSLQDYLFQIQP
jgi:hypothetical protein